LGLEFQRTARSGAGAFQRESASERNLASAVYLEDRKTENTKFEKLGVPICAAFST
jgi:hypothetical protein